MSITTTSGPWNASLGPSWKEDLSHPLRHESCVPKSISDPTSPTRTSSLHPSPNTSWEQSYSSFQTSSRARCPRVHYHQWCEDCLTQTEWEQRLPISQRSKMPTPTFGELKTAVREKSLYQSRFAAQTGMHKTVHKICSRWKDELFTKAVAKRSAKMAAREALCQSVRRQREGCGAGTAAASATGSSTQMSTSSCAT